jgi:hypothetical protein
VSLERTLHPVLRRGGPSKRLILGPSTRASWKIRWLVWPSHRHRKCQHTRMHASSIRLQELGIYELYDDEPPCPELRGHPDQSSSSWLEVRLSLASTLQQAGKIAGQLCVSYDTVNTHTKKLQTACRWAHQRRVSHQLNLGKPLPPPGLRQSHTIE